MELAQPTAGCQQPTGLDPLRSFGTGPVFVLLCIGREGP